MSGHGSDTLNIWVGNKRLSSLRICKLLTFEQTCFKLLLGYSNLVILLLTIFNVKCKGYKRVNFPNQYNRAEERGR